MKGQLKMQKYKTLLVIIPDQLTSLVVKGEITARYYNPGNLFEEVHILMTNDDKPNFADVQKTVGEAKLYLHNLPAPSFKKTLGWRSWFLKRWSRKAVDLAREIKPELIRCHGSHLNGYAAAMIKKELNISYVVSLHINPDEDTRKRAKNWRSKLKIRSHLYFEKITLANADMVLPVYEPIIAYLKRMNVVNYKVIYNTLNPDFLKKKVDYKLHDPVKVISVGRLIKEKCPDNLIRAIKTLNAELMIVGDGAQASYLRQVAQDENLLDRVVFRPAIQNDELCKMLPEYDIFATHSEYWEISKSVLEPLLIGLPVILNNRIGDPVPELQGDFLMLVENTIEGYRHALEKLINDNEFREQLGRKAYAHAQKNWAPEKMEAKYVEVYKRVMANG
jgi:glycosyltransferase involved in cell wall biosynthesis